MVKSCRHWGCSSAVEQLPFKQLVEGSIPSSLTVTYFLYVIKSETSGKIYIGQTNNIIRRVDEHNNQLLGKKKRYTRRDGPWKLIYKEDYSTRNEAIQRERSLKSHKGRDWLKSLNL